MNKIVIIIQARMGSTRLPGKVMMELGGVSILSHVIQRCRAVSGVDEVICAIPDKAENNPIIDEATKHGASVYLGSEHDVLDRYLGAAQSATARTIMRVTSDCPLIDPDVCEKVLNLLSTEGLDYACNNLPPSFPHGLDCEAFSYDVLERAAAEAKDPYEREHVTPWIRTNDNVRKQNLYCEDSGLHSHRWTLDYPEDLDFFRAICDQYPEDLTNAKMDDILSVLGSNPDITALNLARIDTARNSVVTMRKR